jgi:diacylglycerol kinase (ATP)
MVMAAGGQGLLAEVAAGLDGSLTPMGIIPLGTASVLAHEFGLPFLRQAAAASGRCGRASPASPSWAAALVGRQSALQSMVLGSASRQRIVFHSKRCVILSIEGSDDR